jgi:hypothetical protein
MPREQVASRKSLKPKRRPSASSAITLPKRTREDFTEKALSDLLRQIKRDAHSLTRFAGERGSKLATRGMLDVTTLYVSLLNKCPSELLEPIGQSEEVWPALIGPHRDQARANNDLLRRLSIGKKSFLRVPIKGRSWTTRTPAIEIAKFFLEMVQLARRQPSRIEPSPDSLEERARALPEFTRKTARQWGSVVCDAFFEWIPRPEKNKECRKLGEHRKNHSLPSGRDRAAKTPGATLEADVRDGIRESLKLAVCRIAPVR